MSGPSGPSGPTSENEAQTAEERKQEDVEYSKALIALLDSWVEEDEEEDERETWDLLKRYLDEDRTSYRKLFPEQEEGVLMSAPISGASSVAPRSREQTLAILAKLAPSLRALGVRALGLFGSYARNEQHLQSDVDLLVTFDRVSFLGYMDAKLLIEDTLGLPVDLVIADDLRPRLSEHVFSEVIYVQGLSPLS